jgi:4-amino-4-deoxy-L-arabinose transferase-like glycosyltransferase
MRRAFCAVAFIAFLVIVPRAANIGLAGAYVDPVGRVTAQDEALYSHSAIAMATRGDWLTPHFMGRFGLYKPPILYWGAGLCAKLFGISHLTLRLPSVLFAALAVGLIFLWGAEITSWQAGVAAAVLLLSNRLWDTLGALCMTDAMLVAFFIAAFYALYSDPWLESRAALFGFAAAFAGAILTKGAAGMLPIFVLGLYWLAAPRNYRPSIKRVGLATVLAALFAAPWFAYQLAGHFRWFWAEHVAIEIFGFGAGAPPQTSQEPQAIFYLARLAITDPLLLAVAAAAIPVWFSELRRRDSSATLLACWIAASGATILAWQYRNASYLLPLIPAVALVAAAYSPFMQRRWAPWMLACLATAFLIKCSAPELPWGLAFGKSTVQPLAAPLITYCEQRRGNELIVVDVADDLYASALPLPRLRYAAVTYSANGPRYGLPFDEMGIVTSVEQFESLPRFEPQFRDRLRQWGINSSEPIATLIALRNPEELGALALAHPESDFVIPERYRTAVALAPHSIAPAGPNFFFLIARHRIERTSPPAWTCEM